MNIRRMEGTIFKGISYTAASLTILALVLILGRITLEAIPSLSLEMIFTPESEAAGFGGGLANAIIGTIILSLGSTLLATPFAVGTAIYLKRYAGDGKFVRFFSFMLDVMSGTPSIVLGIFALLLLVYSMRTITGGFSMISGIIALAILILPVLERASEAAIESVPTEIEHASYALGANKWETIKLITIPYALSGILTGFVLSVGRAAEESAVVILSAGYSQFIPEFKTLPNEKFLFGIKIYPFQDLIAALPITVYHSFEFPHMIDRSEGFAAAFVLIAIVMIINAIARLIVWRRRIG
ncbi:phosphate ABC transporter permease PstA [Methanolobus zinderi]|uniref:Phosphate transport system permease protein PstA n=2 Tax=Methanolobus zinderi TaxID=536044 RepID=A0A7D5E910_9EURY|nr:phosphate ABC transporter permease PstA [Methanolobus zinderi]